MIINSPEHEMSELIAAVSDELQQHYPGLFQQKNYSYKAAFERYSYFEGLSNAEMLYPLLNILRGNINKNAPTAGEDIILQHYAKLKASRTLHLRCYLRPWLKLFQYLTLALKNSFSPGESLSATKKVFGIFVTQPRFMMIFEPLVQQFGREKCELLTANTSVSYRWIGKRQFWRVFRKLIGVVSNWLKRGPLSLLPMFLLFHLFRQDITYRLKQSGVRVLVFAEGTSHYDEIARLAAESHNIKTVRIQSGRAGILHTGYRTMNFDLMLCWSEDFVERYQIYSPHLQYRVVGAPVLSEFASLKSRLVPENRDKSILILTQPVTGDRFVSDSDYQLTVEISQRLIDMDDALRVFVRKHPADNDTRFDELAAKKPKQIILIDNMAMSLAESFSKAVCVVGFYSTALSEAAACGLIPVVIHTRNAHSVYPFPEKHGAAIVKKGVGDASLELMQIIYHPELYVDMKQKMKAFSNKFFGPEHGSSIKRTVQEIEKFMQQNHAS